MGPLGLSSDHRPDAEAFGEHAATFAGLAVRRLHRGLLQAQAQLWREVLHRQPEDFGGLFRALAASSQFRALWAQRHCRAPFLLPAYPFVKQALTLADIAAGFEEAAGRGAAIPAALVLLRAPAECINSALPPIRSRSELEQVLGFGTIFLNAASKHWRALAALCRHVGSAVGFPANVNVYATAPGRTVSTPAHSDHHDVLVLQVQGEKHWRVFRPLPREPGGLHPCHRGKGEDVLEEAALGEPLLDVRLRPGESLFVPAGFVHATSTAAGTDAGSCADASVHLTLGLSVADCGLTYGTLCGQVLLESGQESGVDEELLDDDAFWALHEPLPLGCLAPRGFQCGEELRAYISAELTVLVQRCGNLATAAPNGSGGAALGAVVRRVVHRWLRIREDLLEIYDRGYQEVIAAAGSIVAVGLADRPNASTFHARRQIGEDDPKEPETDPLVEAATASIVTFCDFLRAHIPEAEIKWDPATKAGDKLAVQIDGFEPVD